MIRERYVSAGASAWAFGHSHGERAGERGVCTVAHCGPGGGELLYAFVIGFYLDANDAAVNAAHLAPLTVTLAAGPCPVTDHPQWDEASDGWICKRESLAQIHVGSPDDMT